MPRHSELIDVGETGLKISRYSLGTAPLAGLYQNVDEEESDCVIEKALTSGMNYFDTAPLYGSGVGEKRLGRVLKESSKRIVVSTKVGRILLSGENPEATKWPDADPNVIAQFDYSAEGIRRSLEESLVRLGLDHIDIAYIHDPDDLVKQAIEIVYPVLDDLRQQGIIKAVGVGTNFCGPAVEIMNAVDLDIVLIAGRYTLLDQTAQLELFPTALQRGVSVVAAGVYNSGILANPIVGSYFNYEPASAEILKRAQLIREYLSTQGVPLTAAALQFPLRHLAVTSVLNGSASLKEIEENITNFNFKLPDNLWDSMESAGLIIGEKK
jgi:D-threo-aldose 1-dehydrogenase